MLLTGFAKHSTQKSLGQLGEKLSLCNLNVLKSNSKPKLKVQNISYGTWGHNDAGH